ncbi:MAG: transcriptional regulator, AraC family [Candidatus Eremiobacteraeota bacterium]|nr:transcriptional regulator, AraC family [Candidatus Eremiobacteraeota bacterium]
MNTSHAGSGSVRFPEAYTEALETILEFELRRIRSTAVARDLPPAERARRRFMAVTDYVEERLEGKIALPELAALMALSVSRFAHAFKTEFGVSPYRYITARRIERAKALLRTTDYTIARIAHHVGFPSHAHFSHGFATIAGVTPSAYRSAGPSP